MVVAVLLLSPMTLATSVAPQKPIVIGYPGGDDWEPSVAADSHGNVYVVWAHFGGVPGCSGCGTSAAMVEISRDGGRSFGPPEPLHPGLRPQVDLNVQVGSSGEVFVTYLAGKDTVLQRSTDEGRSWSSQITLNTGVPGATDKPGLVVWGQSVYVAFDINGRGLVAASHDDGRTFALNRIVTVGFHLGFSLTAGGSAAPDGTVYFAWNGVHHPGTALTPQDNYLTRSSDGGASWTVLPVARNLPGGPACPQSCGWDYLGPQMVVAATAAGRVFVAYNAGEGANGSAPHVWFRSSADRGATWSPPTELSKDGTNSWHTFPAIDAIGSGSVFVAWMDNRSGAYNVWYRTSSDGGLTWSDEAKVSSFVPGLPYANPSGFAFPYGDYFILNAHPRNQVNIAWGEGPNWTGPGNIFYSRIVLPD